MAPRDGADPNTPAPRPRPVPRPEGILAGKAAGRRLGDGVTIPDTEMKKQRMLLVSAVAALAVMAAACHRGAKEAAALAGAKAEELAAAKVGDLRSADLGGGVKLDLCGIPAGKFTMGGDGGGENAPKHEVTLTKAFWLGRTEVTQAQWEAVMGKNSSWFKGKDLPVEHLSWKEATEFCGRLNAQGLLPTGWKWALPTEAQWEYACRAGTAGDYAGDLDEIAWYAKNSGRKTHSVAAKKPNAWGLFDMHGNLWEWCADWYGYYPTASVTDPTGPDAGLFRVYRGGDWNCFSSFCRSANRGWHLPGTRCDSGGFRIAAVPVGK